MRSKCKLSLCPHKPVHAGTHICTWSGLWGHWLFSTFPLWDFSFFYFLFFFFALKKHKNVNKRISDFFPLRCFLSAFFIFIRLFAFLYFCLVAFLCFLCFLVLLVLFGAFLCVRNLFVKNNKKFKTALITSFISLLPITKTLLHIYGLQLAITFHCEKFFEPSSKIF